MEKGKVYDLEKRTYAFAKSTRVFVKILEKTIWNREDIRPVVRSSGSVAANYIEANENLGDKDFLMKIRTCKREIKESILWFRLLDIGSERVEQERLKLVTEATELKNIFGAIYRNRISKN